jgi:hypothetical protein
MPSDILIKEVRLLTNLGFADESGKTGKQKDN